MDSFDLDVRRHVYFSVVANGRPPTTVETAAAFHASEPEIADAYRRLHEAHALEGAVLASDAFFPFADGPQLALAAGITVLVQPGGSKRDAEVIAAVDAAGAAMVLTGRRHFRH